MKNQSSKLLKQTVKSVNRFQFDFYNQFSEPENLIISPLGLYLVLAMLHEGARGETRKVLSNLLHHDDPEISVTSGLRILLKELNSRTQLTALEKKEVEEKEAHKNELISRGEWNEDYVSLFGTATAEDIRLDLSIANGMWLQDTYEYKSEFLNIVRTEMAAEVGYLDFDNDPVLACKKVNNWISEKTRGLIKDMISPDKLPKPCLLLLGNALYFKSRWENEFGDPIAGPFHLLDGTSVEAQMMTNNVLGLGYMQTGSFLAVELPYYHRPLSMFILTPVQYGAEAFVKLELEFYHHWRSFQLYRQTEFPRVTLTMPEFKIKADHSFKHQLTASGVGDIFSQKADFSGVSDEEVVYVSDIIQNTYVAVDQHGTEAAAATFATVFTGLGGEPEEKVILTIDRPFLFAIVDKPTGVILFVGKVTNPI